jgi:hypothetical protein
MTIRRFATYSGSLALGALIVTSSASLPTFAEDSQALATASHQHPGQDQKSRAGELVRTIREATARFRDVAVAEAEEYHLMFGCVSGPDVGAMGLHYVNMSLVGDGVLDATHPEIVIYEPLPNGNLRLIGADFLVLADQWHEKNPAPPQLIGQLFHLFESPNRFGLPTFYTLHVWAWKDNPSGTFVNWHPQVSCDKFDG